jgi:glycosyltransferase involved in cell wall biosynthesis
MPGFVANPHAYMSQANVFVLSSAWEGLPGVLIEAMACGVPVVSTNSPGGSAEILENGKYGRLTPAGDEQALAEAIFETLAHPPSGEVLRQRALDFSIEKILPQYLNIFQRPLS